MEDIFYMLWRGLAIGILVSAPMGPVGMLCIQRTLNKGRKSGLYTGFGAAVSDLFYCILTGFGLSFIEGFLERNQDIIQLIGSAVLIGFGLYIFRQNPSHKLKKAPDAATSHKTDFISGFLFTFSNPLILFLIVGLFARFNFLLPEFRYYHYASGYLSIFCGALLWWFLITFFVNKVRSHFNVRSLWLVNRIIGSILIVMAAIGLIISIYDYVTGG